MLTAHRRRASDPRIAHFTSFATMALTALIAGGLALLVEGRPAAAAETGSSASAGLEYLVVTTGGAQADEALPLVLAVHGMGDRPESFARLFQGLPLKARVIVPRAPRPHGDGGSWYLTRREDKDKDARAASIEDAATRLATLLEELSLSFPTTGRAVVTGFSQGGVLSFILAIRHPALFKLAVPLSGELPWLLRPRPPEVGTRAPRIRALHGSADRLFSLDGTQRGVEHLVGLDYDAVVTSYPGIKHKLSPEMRKELYRLLAEALGR